MTRFTLLLFVGVLALTGCKKKQAPEQNQAGLELVQVPDFIVNAPAGKDGSRYTRPQGDLVKRFDGELTDDDQRQPEDNSRVDLLPVELAEGRWYTFVMWADNYDAFLMVETPNDKQATNDDCMDIYPTIACVTFQAPVDGTYTIRANAFDASSKNKGKYRVEVYEVAQPPVIEGH